MPFEFEETFTLGILLDTVTELCKERGITIKTLEKELKFGNGTIRRWDTSKPAISAVVKVACYFDVSVDYLLGLSSYRQHDTQNLTASDLGLSERAATTLSVYQKSGAKQLLKTVNSLLEAEPLDHGHSPLQTIAAYLFFRKEVEYIYKIAEDGDIVVSNLSNKRNQNRTDDYLIDFCCNPLLTIDDQTLFNEALYNIMCESLRTLKAELRQKGEKGEPQNGKLQDND